MFFLLTAFLALPSVRAEAQDELYFGIVPLEADAGRLSPLGTGENKFFETVVCLDTSSDVLVGKLEGCEIVGVRCFLNYEYRQKSKEFSAITVYEGDLESEPSLKFVNFEEGWNEVYLDQPIPINAGKTYVGMRVFELLGSPYPFAVYDEAGTVGAYFKNEGKSGWTHVENVSQPDPSLDGKLIHATAFTRTADSLCDVTFGIGAVAVRLERTVQYYQWVEDAKTETRDKIGGGQEEVTTYTYSREWVGSPVNSQEFKDADYRRKNFVVMNLEDECYLAENVTFGAYRLPENLISSISGTVPMELDFSKGQLKQWDRDVRMCFESKAKAEPDSTAVPDNVPDDTADAGYVHVNGNVLYFGKNPNEPQIGDMSITFTKVLPGEASVIAEVNGTNLRPFVAKNGKEFSALTMGTASMEEMYQSEHTINKNITWILRIAGLLLVILGLKGIFSILTTLLKVLPFLANIAELGVNLVCSVLGLVWSLLVIALAWLFYRPVIAGVLLVVIIALVVFLVRKGKSEKHTEETVV